MNKPTLMALQLGKIVNPKKCHQIILLSPKPQHCGSQDGTTKIWSLKLNNTDFVYNHIYKGSLHGGAVERIAHDCAVMGLNDYKRGKFKKASDLIEKYVKQAKQRTKKLKKVG